MPMKIIRTRRRGYALLLAASVFLAAYLVVMATFKAALATGVLGIIFLLLLVRESRLLHDAALIWDNRILVVPDALITRPGGHKERDTEETVVSTFGILIGSHIYRWGLDGMHGVQLHRVRIEGERMYLFFGGAAQSMRLELRHGLSHQQSVRKVAQKLRYETGVSAEIVGW